MYKRIYVTGEDLGIPLTALLNIKRIANKTVIVAHNITKKKALALRILGHKSIHKFVVLSNSQAEALRRAGIPQSKIQRCWQWVDSEFYSPSNASENPDASFMACGAENRDYDTLISAASLAGAHVNIYGHGFFVSKTIHPKIDSKYVNFEKRVSFLELRESYNSCKAVILPINNVEYAAGVTGLVEAMSMGKFVIFSNSVGISDYIEQNPGCIVGPGDVQSLARALIEVNQGRFDIEKIGQKNRAWIVANAAISKYASIIQKIMTED